MNGLLGGDRPLIFTKYSFFVALLLCHLAVQAQLNASFQPNRTQGCSPLVVFFTNTSSGQPDSCYWEFGNGNNSSQFSPATTFTEPGTYSVELTIFKGGQQSRATRNITVFRDPEPDFSAPILQGCAPVQINFRDQSKTFDAPITNWLWDFGNGRGSSEQNPTATFPSAGIFGIRLVVTDANGCRGTITSPNLVEVVAPPVASFRIRDSVACSLPFVTSFIDSSKSVQPLSYLWDFGDGTTSTLANPSHTYQSAGNFNVRLQVENQFGCKDDTVRTGSIKVESFEVGIELSDTFGCIPTEIAYQALSNAPVASYLWDFGNGQSSTTADGIANFSMAGSYVVSLSAISRNGCSATNSRTVRIGNIPIVDFSATPIDACRPPLTVQFINLSQGASAYRWDFGDGTVSMDENPSKTYTRRDSFFVRLSATSQEGCVSSLIRRNYIIIQEPNVSIQASNTGGCLPFTTTFSIQKTGPGTISDILWDFGNGSTFQGINPPPQTYITPGNFTVRATVSFSVGNCQDRTVTTRISVGNPPPGFNGTVSSNQICANTSVGLNATGGAGVTFSWDMGNGEMVTGRTANYVYRIPGTFTIRLTATNSGCPVTIVVGQVKVEPPAANFNVSTLCGGWRVQFRNASEGATTSTWNFGDGSGSIVDNNLNVFHNFPGYGIYNVKLIVSNSSTGCTDSVSRQIDLRDDRPRMQLASQIGCSPLQVRLADTTGIFRSFIWRIADTVLSGNNSRITLAQPGSYSVTVTTLDQQGCRDTFSFKDIVKVVKPVAGFSFNPLGGCAPITVNFRDTSKSEFSNVNAWNWDFGGIGTSGLRNPSFSFALTDTVPVALVVTDNLGCKDTATNELPISFPKAQFTADFNSICTGVSYPIRNESFGVALKYFWDFGDGRPISNEPDPQPVYTQEGTYSISLLVVDDNQCRDSITKTNFVKVENFTYDFSADNTFKTCPELITKFNIIPSDILYNEAFWDFGNGNFTTDTTRFPVNIYAEAGTYDVSLFLEDYRGCRDTVSKPAFIRIEGPSGSLFVEPDSGCVPLDVVIKADIKNSKVNFWDFGDGSSLLDTVMINSIPHTYVNPGRAATSLVLDDGLGCVVLVRGPTVFASFVDAEMLPSAKISCNQEVVTFTDVSRTRAFSPVVSRVWNFGDGTIASDDSIVSHRFEVNNTKPFTVRLTVTNTFGCFDTDSTEVSVYFEPPLETDGDKVVCLGDEVQLNASGVLFYEWLPNASITQTDVSNPVVRPLKDTEFIVKGYDVPNCPDFDTIRVKVINKVTGSAGADTSICLGDEVLLRALPDEINSGSFSYQWMPAEWVENPSEANTAAKPVRDQVFTVRISNGNCEALEWPVYVSVTKPPDVGVSEGRTIFSGQEVLLSAYSSSTSLYEWSPSESLSCADCPYPMARPLTSTDYKVKVIGENGCSDSATIKINVVETCDGELLTLPNVFSPNNDGLNDQFMVRGTGIRSLRAMKIFSRTGELVFENYDINKGWDGKRNGMALNSGVYVYYIEFDCENGNTSIAQGNITLLR